MDAATRQKADLLLQRQLEEAIILAATQPCLSEGGWLWKRGSGKWSRELRRRFFCLRSGKGSFELQYFLREGREGDGQQRPKGAVACKDVEHVQLVWLEDALPSRMKDRQLRTLGLHRPLASPQVGGVGVGAGGASGGTGGAGGVGAAGGKGEGRGEGGGGGGGGGTGGGGGSGGGGSGGGGAAAAKKRLPRQNSAPASGPGSFTSVGGFGGFVGGSGGGSADDSGEGKAAATGDDPQLLTTTTTTAAANADGVWRRPYLLVITPQRTFHLTVDWGDDGTFDTETLAKWAAMLMLVCQHRPKDPEEIRQMSKNVQTPTAMLQHIAAAGGGASGSDTSDAESVTSVGGGAGGGGGI